MGNSKIKTIQSSGTYDSQNGLMYKFEIELESGESGEVSAKSESRWRVGDLGNRSSCYDSLPISGERRLSKSLQGRGAVVAVTG